MILNIMLLFCGKKEGNKMAKSPHKNFNLPLPEDTHRALFDESRRSGIPATRLVRSALEAWLQKKERENRRNQVRDFALEHAGSEYDLDPTIESMAAEELRDFDEDDHETR